MLKIFGYKNLSGRAKLALLLICSLVLTACASRKLKSDSGLGESRDPKVESAPKSADSTAKAYTTPRVSVDSAKVNPADSSSFRVDQKVSSLDSLQGSTKQIPRMIEDPSFKEIIDYSAEDSMVMLKSKEVFFFGPSNVKYQDKEISSNFMKMNADSSLVYARYTVDSKGNPEHFPSFKDGESQYQAKTLNYNFSTQKGFIEGVVTQQGEGYVTATATKKMADNTMYMCDGKYTTCDHVEHPHFYIALTKAKVRPNKNIVAGPAYLVIADVPIYLLGLPFGFFPFSNKYSSGIIPPSYGEERERGFYLRNGGYYFAFNDYIDLAVTGDIYSKGSWALNAQSQYRKRYKYSGNIDAGYLVTTHGYTFEKDVYSKSKDFHINWTHTQDPKANPNSNFSAGVNFSTSSYDRNSINGIYGPGQSYAQNTKSSNINYRHTFAGTPWSISTSFNITQRTSDSTIAVTLPDMNIAMNSIYPFKRKRRIGSEKWYEKIRLSYSGQLRNSITTKEDKLFKSSLIKDWDNGMTHRIPIDATFTLFNYINVTPSINYNERWYTKKNKMAYSPVQNRLAVVDTSYGFFRTWDFNTSLGLSTTLYGFYKPWRFLFGDKVSVIRHRVSPSVSFSYSPDFSDPFFKAYKEVRYKDKDGVWHQEKYSPFKGQSIGYPGMGKQASINYSFSNNVEAKVRSDQDSTGFKKVSIIDDFTWSQSYNAAADSLKFSNINTSLRLKLPGNFNISLSGSFDPYVYKTYKTADGGRGYYKSDKLMLFNGKGIGALISTGTSFSYTFSNDKFSKWFGKKDKTAKKKKNSEEDDEEESDQTDQENAKEDNGKKANLLGNKEDDGDFDRDGYLKNKFNWNLTFNYSVNYGRSDFNFDKERFNYKLTHNLSFNSSINPTKNWSITMNGNYNFDLKKITNLQFGVTRDMHCWAISAGFIPIGFYKSYNIMISVKSSLLQDIKWQETDSPRYGNDWY